MYTTKHCRIEELVPPDFFELYKDRPWILWAQLDDLCLMGIDLIWEHFSNLQGHKVTIIINDWLWGGHVGPDGKKVSWTRCGFRPGPPLPGESKAGQHPLGKAFDLHILQVTAEEARQEILRSKEKFAPYIRRMERNVNWLHVDRANYGENSKEIYLIDPPR